MDRIDGASADGQPTSPENYPLQPLPSAAVPEPVDPALEPNDGAKREARKLSDASPSADRLHHYSRSRKQLLQESQPWYAEAMSTASPAEKKVGEIIDELRKNESRDRSLFGNLPGEAVPEPRSRDSGGQFLVNRPSIDMSTVMAIARGMPKGAHQHIHFNTALPPEELLGHAQTPEVQDTMFIRSTLPLTNPENFQNCEIVFNVFPKETVSADCFSSSYNRDTEDPENSPWMLWKVFRESFPERVAPTGPENLDAAGRWARSKMVISVEHTYGHTTTHNSSWAYFNQSTRALKGLVGYESGYRWYIGRAIDNMIEDNVMYAELRPMLFDKAIPSTDGLRKLDLKEQMSIICGEIIKKRKELEARNELDKFPFGIKIIYCTPRSISLAEMETELEDCIWLKLQFPDLICGFDLVGAEDRPNCIKFYADVLLAFQQRCKELKISIPFMFHAGETLLDTGGSSDPDDSNLYDALLLNAKRIGHGYALLKHPHLVEKYKKQNICLELCPISNELLHLCGNAREHPYPQLLAAGLHCTLNADNPALFSSTLSYEFYQVMVGDPRMNIHGWKQLAEWSLEHSCLSPGEIHLAKGIYARQWEAFCQWVVDEYGWQQSKEMWCNVVLGVWALQPFTFALSHKHVGRTLPALEIEERANGHGGEDTTTEEDYFHFVTRPDIRAFKWSIQKYDERAVAPGYWFVAPYELLGQKERGAKWIGPYIYNGKGELVWSGAPMFDSFNVFDFRPVEIHEQNMFTAIYKREDAGVIVDNSYQIRKMVQWPGGSDAANMHEFSVFDEGAKVAVLTREMHHASTEKSKVIGYDGECSINTDGLLELDISGDSPIPLFNWSWIDHMSLDEITYPTKLDVKKECKEGWDANHCNAIDRFDNGDYLVSCRHTDTLYKISRESGSVLWRLGGTNSDFKFVGEAKFSRQHHARILESNATHTVLTLFDNARGEGIQTATHDCTRGLILSLHADKAQMVAEYPRPDHEYSTSRGSLEIMPNGNVFIGWTFHSRISEHSAEGKLLMKAKLPPRKNTYRSYKAPWTGRPVDSPDVVSRVKEQGLKGYTTQVYVSWNGATDVVKWSVYRADQGGSRYIHAVIVEAIGAKGEPLGQSKVVETIPTDRNAAQFTEEQRWLDAHVPNIAVDLSYDAQGQLYPPSPDPELPSFSSPADDWEGLPLVGQHAKLMAYVAGILTCCVFAMLYWAGSRLKQRLRRRQLKQGYTQVYKDDDENEHELDEGVGQDADTMNGSTGRLRKG
ncbi:uncharacterized protein LTR77_010971 [Saxophila tyrrhenica]|uniref:Adenosine deaminase domain-containing protein n=1 Tax=Saxophila tyrrhenica TaxID=1690608 RepID=A0AAV9NTW5_9PEZI|nr:hypothetical protein LTR77_010971 [Saxophila tyrrhenica]